MRKKRVNFIIESEELEDGRYQLTHIAEDGWESKNLYYTLDQLGLTKKQMEYIQAKRRQKRYLRHYLLPKGPNTQLIVVQPIDLERYNPKNKTEDHYSVGRSGSLVLYSVR